MKLAIDIGNTRLKAGLFDDGDEMVKEASWAAFSLGSLTDWLSGYHIVSSIVVASGDVPEGLEEYLQSRAIVLFLTHQTPIPLTMHYQTPETLGRDRIAGAVGAYMLQPNMPCIKIDCGTCLTIDYIGWDAENGASFEGGIISLGLNMRLQAMHHFTARLPQVSVNNGVDLIGKNTTEAMQSGALWGIVAEIEGAVSRLSVRDGSSARSADPRSGADRRELRTARPERSEGHAQTINIVITGGDSPMILPFLGFSVRNEPTLVLKGLFQILTYNAL